MGNAIHGILRKEHEPSDLASALADKDLYINESHSIDETELVSELADYLRSKYRKNYYNGSNTPKGIAETKARAILGIDEVPKNSKIDRHYKPTNIVEKRPIERFSEVIEAMKAGKISQIKLNFPWHPKIFWNENLPTTFPFQHTTAILYTGQAKHIFFSKEGKKFQHEKYDQPRNPKSAFVQGEIKGGNRYERTGNKTAVYLGDIKQASAYPLTDAGKISEEAKKTGERGKTDIYRASPVIEAHLKTENLEVMAGSENGNNPKTLSDLQEKYSTPENLLEESRKKGHIPEFMTTLGENDLSLDRITGIWDWEYTSEVPHFVPLKKYYKMIKKRHPGRVPDPEEVVFDVANVDTGGYQQKVRRIVKFEKAMEKLPKFTGFASIPKDLSGTTIQSESDLEQFISTLRRMEENIPKYNEEISELRDFMEKEFSLDINWTNVRLDEFIKKSMDEESPLNLGSIRTKIKKTGNKHLKKEKIPKEELKKAEKEMLEELRQLPEIKADKKQLARVGIMAVDIENSQIGKKELEKTIVNNL